MSIQAVFQRYELKYMITAEQKTTIQAAMEAYMEMDQYGRTTIRNLYFDTDTYLLVRRSIEKPAYKEKLRVRSYSQAACDSTVFVELKKKFESVVYKRRIAMPYREAMDWLTGERYKDSQTQIGQEIDYVINYYGTLHPVVFLSYEREAWYTKQKSDFRVTFDENVLVRQEDLSLGSQVYGTPILPKGMVLMEMKCTGGIPLWMTQVLSREEIYKTTFSKYGTAYKNLIFQRKLEESYHD